MWIRPESAWLRIFWPPFLPKPPGWNEATKRRKEIIKLRLSTIQIHTQNNPSWLCPASKQKKHSQVGWSYNLKMHFCEMGSEWIEKNPYGFKIIIFFTFDLGMHNKLYKQSCFVLEIAWRDMVVYQRAGGGIFQFCLHVQGAWVNKAAVQKWKWRWNDIMVHRKL